MDEQKLEFAKKLKQLRKNRDWSQGQVAKKIGVESERISKYERGILYPTTELLLKLADIFEVSVDYLLRNGAEILTHGIKNQDLLDQVKEVDQLEPDQQEIVIALLRAFVKQKKLEELMNT